RWTAAFLFLVLAAANVRLAWICDDAYITLRTVENWIAGYGPTWNVDERAQTFTHPLWMLVLTAARLLTCEAYFTTIGLRLVLALAAAAVVLSLGRSAGAAAAVAALLLGARSFSEYATGGLENPLSYLLLALLARAVTRDAPGGASLGRVAVLSGLIALTRM